MIGHYDISMFYFLSSVSVPDEGMDLCFSPSNKMLMVSVGMDAQVKCFDIQTRK